MWFYSTTTKKSNHAVNQPGISAMLSDLKSHYNLISRFYLTTLLNFDAPPASLQGGKKHPSPSTNPTIQWGPGISCSLSTGGRARAPGGYFLFFIYFPCGAPDSPLAPPHPAPPPQGGSGLGKEWGISFPPPPPTPTPHMCGVGGGERGGAGYINITTKKRSRRPGSDSRALRARRSLNWNYIWE